MTAACADIIQEIEAADDERFRAKAAYDWSGLAKVLADELVYVHVTARTDSKASLLESLGTRRVHYLGGTRRDVSVRAFDDIALMNGKLLLTFEMGGVRHASDSVFVSAWVRRDGRWQMAHWHSTAIAQQ